MSLLSLFTISVAYAARYVAVSGTDSGDCQDSSAPCATISYALSQATDNDTIRLGIGAFDVSNELLSRNLTIQGEGMTSTTIDAKQVDRAFTINGNVTVYISDLKIKNGLSSTNGGALSVEANSSLYLENCEIINNEANDFGGAIYASGSGTIDISNCKIEENTSQQHGGALAIYGNDLIIRTSSLSNNESVDGSGGGIYTNGATVEIEQSTINDNKAGTYGGGLCYGTLTAEIRNSTFSGNQAKTSGGGIYNAGGTITLDNVTIANNTADVDSGQTGDTVFGDGGGIFNEDGSATTKLRNTIVAANKDGSGENPDCGGTLTSEGYNLIQHESSGNCTFAAESTDITGEDAKLFPLDDNEGPTETHALQSDSPAIDKGSCEDTNGYDIPEDQRGSERPEETDCDIGAYELSVCGDNVWGIDEECEDGNTVDTDDCTSECKDNICGDGFVFEDYEDCDDGNTEDGDGCDSSCYWEEGLGNCSLMAHANTEPFIGLGLLIFGILMLLWRRQKI